MKSVCFHSLFFCSFILFLKKKIGEKTYNNKNKRKEKKKKSIIIYLWTIYKLSGANLFDIIVIFRQSVWKFGKISIECTYTPHIGIKEKMKIL